MFPQDNGQGQPAPAPAPTQPVQQPVAQPTQQPAPQPAELSLDNLIVDNPQVQEQPTQQSQPQAQATAEAPMQQQQTQQEAQLPNVSEEPAPAPDPYAQSGGVRTIRAQFDQYLEEKFPIKGKLDINSIDKKDPEAFARFMNDMQEASRSDIINQQLREQATAEFEQQLFEPVYQVFPKLKQDPTTDGLVRMLYKGAAADNPNISPVQVANAFSNFTRQLYNAAVKSVQANVQSIPTPPAGGQGRAATKILNNEVVEKYAGGGIDDVAQLIANMQGKGVGGL